LLVDIQMSENKKFNYIRNDNVTSVLPWFFCRLLG